MTKNNLKGQQELSATFVFLAVTFCVCLITSNFFVPRLWRVGNTSLQLSAAVILFPISYIINDLLTEVYGYRKAMQVIWMGFIMSAFVAIMSHLATLLPDPLLEDSQSVAGSFNSLFGMVPRTSAASLLAFILGSHVNAWIMSWMKVTTKGKGFGWRAVVSSVVGELADSTIFYPLAFAGVLPFRVIVSIVFTQVTVKTLYEVIVLPLTAVLAQKLKGWEGIDTYDYSVKYNPFNFSKIQ